VATPATQPPRLTTKIFGTPAALWTTYSVRLAFRDKLIGGIPKDPKLIEGWLRSKAGIDDPQDLRLAVLRTLQEIGDATPEVANPDDDGLAQSTMLAAPETDYRLQGRRRRAVRRVPPGESHAQGEHEYRLCRRAVGSDEEGVQGVFAERVFVEPDKLLLGVQEPTGVELVLGISVAQRARAAR